ncbi:Predicted dehydrogenase [Oceanobacillus limi]|uniref:Predicted dehydrogenase n=1 Tax=Oceanobacillus limi TaxID=930131 RepID=A0A1I0CEX9_9BACI|nr:Gfo/Idh/MocA family oxidoreductase [Oceanobacillus limi]SET17951.1 Predicted dehydrogenase [Oceanobacillus limi]
MIKVGIIGGGFGLKVQAPIIDSHPDMTVTAVSTVNRHQLPEEMDCLKHTPIHYKNWQEMVTREKVELLFVSSMPIHHFKMVKYAIENGVKHIVCEKPFTTTSDESRELLHLAETYDAKVFLDFEWRYVPGRQKMKKLLLDQYVGDILHMEYHVSNAQYQKMLSNQRGWLGEKEKFGGMLGALGSHMIDCLRWLSGEVKVVNGMVHTHVPEGAGEVRDADDSFFIHGVTIDNATFSLQLVTGVNHGFGSSLKVFGTQGTVALINDKQLAAGKANEKMMESIEEYEKEIPSHLSERTKSYFPAFYTYVTRLYDYLVNGNEDPDLATIEDGHRSQEIIDTILES